ncbi:hypothetical protein [Rubellimicrobium aerolatum]|uniref:Uncharacterized protein n=1 Tax=Rubellimicrobium aerolatum TaxID=490979 RepID=A0ABW0SA75_9RHOB|nr:hypothetical protein [Rubellimicrobium aerolatum]MBP1805237.1 dienelactone hydrolase [Rubellimicrobium aerolatum]
MDPMLPVLKVLAGADTIVSTGTPVRVRILPGADHGFDQRIHAVLSTSASIQRPQRGWPRA